MVYTSSLNFNALLCAAPSISIALSFEAPVAFS
jgi:hypothetical protein